jgi:hypothetical protein
VKVLAAVAAALCIAGPARAQGRHPSLGGCPGGEGHYAFWNFTDKTKDLVDDADIDDALRGLWHNRLLPSRSVPCTREKFEGLRARVQDLLDARVVMALGGAGGEIEHLLVPYTAETEAAPTLLSHGLCAAGKDPAALSRYLQRLRVYQAASIALYELHAMSKVEHSQPLPCRVQSAKGFLNYAIAQLRAAPGTDGPLLAYLEQKEEELGRTIAALPARQQDGDCGLPGPAVEILRIDRRLAEVPREGNTAGTATPVARR